MKPPMTSIASTTIRAIGYREEAQELWVDYRSGETRVYPNVGPSEYQRLLASSAAAKGRYVANLLHDTTA